MITKIIKSMDEQKTNTMFLSSNSILLEFLQNLLSNDRTVDGNNDGNDDGNDDGNNDEAIDEVIETPILISSTCASNKVVSSLATTLFSSVCSLEFLTTLSLVPLSDFKIPNSLAPI